MSLVPALVQELLKIFIGGGAKSPPSGIGLSNYLIPDCFKVDRQVNRSQFKSFVFTIITIRGSHGLNTKRYRHKIQYVDYRRN